MICPKCGAELREQAKFCDQCGVALYPDPSVGKSTATLMCGILSIFFSPTVVFGLLFGILAIMMGTPTTSAPPDGKATAGKITGIIGVALAAVSMIAIIILGVVGYDFYRDSPIFQDIASVDLNTLTSTSSSSSAK